MTKPRTKQLKTLADLQQSLCVLYPGAHCQADKVTIRRHDADGVSQRDYFEGQIYVPTSQPQEDPLFVTARGPTLIDVLIGCREKLIEAIEARARKRQLSHQPIVVAPPKRLTHS